MFEEEAQLCKGGIPMIEQESPAVAIAREHAEAWSNHDWARAREGLAGDVHVTATTTQPTMAATNLTGVDDYMDGLIAFAQAVVPGSARVLASVGDERNALLMLTVEADLGGGKVTLPAARLYLLDEDEKIKAEQVVFFAAA
jgi:SnoaL-like domain